MTAGQLEEEGKGGKQRRVGGIQFEQRRQIRRGIIHKTGTSLVGGEDDLRKGGASPLMRGTSSRAQAHFLFLKVNRQPAGVWGVMGKEETVMLIRPAHTSPPNNKTKQEWKHGKTRDNCGPQHCCGPRFELHSVLVVLRRGVSQQTEEAGNLLLHNTFVVFDVFLEI